MGADAITPQSVAQIIQAHAVAAGFRWCYLGGHSLKRCGLITGMERGVHPVTLKRPGRHKSFDALGEYLFDADPLSGVHSAAPRHSGHSLTAIDRRRCKCISQGQIAARSLKAN